MTGEQALRAIAGSIAAAVAGSLALGWHLYGVPDDAGTWAWCAAAHVVLAGNIGMAAIVWRETRSRPRPDLHKRDGPRGTDLEIL